jgi:hypothetical protein
MLCYDWPVADHARLTTNPSDSWLWVVSMGQINFNSLADLKKKKPGCRRVVAFQPTGWSHGGGGRHTPGHGFASPGQSSGGVASAVAGTSPRDETIMKPRRKDGNVIYSTPYSEHSSYSELIDFLKIFRCLRDN